MGYSIFYSYRGMDVKIQGILWLWFFSGVSISRYIFPGGKFAQLFFSEWDTDHFFQISSFIKESDRQRISRGFLSQTVILSRRYWFLKIWSPYPCMDKKWNGPIQSVQRSFNLLFQRTFVLMFPLFKKYLNTQVRTNKFVNSVVYHPCNWRLASGIHPFIFL